MAEYKVTRNAAGEIAMSPKGGLVGAGIIWVADGDFAASIRDGLIPLPPEQANEIHRRESLEESGKAAAAGVMNATTLGLADVAAGQSPDTKLQLRRSKEEHQLAYPAGQIVGALVAGAGAPSGLASAAVQGGALGLASSVGDVATYGEEMAKGEMFTHIMKGVGIGAATAMGSALLGSGLSGLAKRLKPADSASGGLTRRIAAGALGYAVAGPVGSAIAAVAGSGLAGKLASRLGYAAGRGIARSASASAMAAVAGSGGGQSLSSRLASHPVRHAVSTVRPAAVLSALEIGEISRSIETADPANIDFGEARIPEQAKDIVRQRTASALAEIKAALPVNPEPDRLGTTWVPSVKERMEFTHIMSSVMDATYPLRRLANDMATPREIAVLRSTAPEVHAQLQEWAQESIKASRERGVELSKKQAMNLFSVTGDTSLLPYAYSAKMLGRLQALRAPKQTNNQGKDMRVAAGYQTLSQGVQARSQK